jgi:hypothetical protein
MTGPDVGAAIPGRRVSDTLQSAGAGINMRGQDIGYLRRGPRSANPTILATRLVRGEEPGGPSSGGLQAVC